MTYSRVFMDPDWDKPTTLKVLRVNGDSHSEAICKMPCGKEIPVDLLSSGGFADDVKVQDLVGKELTANYLFPPKVPFLFADFDPHTESL